jgi:large subunit ribosomal protein L3
MKFIIGVKKEMAQMFDAEGVVTPVTIIEVAPNTVTQVKSKEKEGYVAVQLGSGVKRENKLSKAEKGHLKDLGAFAHLREFLLDSETTLKRGDKVDLSIFQPGEYIAVSGITKGKGFQGVVKRHGFGGGPRTHGQKHSEREPGSIGSGLRTRVPKAMRMAGRMGGTRVTVQGLKVMNVDSANNYLLVKGAVPGRRGTLLEIRG